MTYKILAIGDDYADHCRESTDSEGLPGFNYG